MGSWTRRGALMGGLALVACTPEEQQAIFDAVLGGAGTGSGLGGLTQADAAAGLRAALDQGIGSAVSIVGREGGYFNDPQIRIPLPPFLEDIRGGLAPFGMAGLLDDVERNLNAAAEAAAPMAQDIFIDAIRNITIADAVSIVRGPSTAATDYLKRVASPRLVTVFTPPMETMIERYRVMVFVDRIDALAASIPQIGRLGDDAKTELVDHGVRYALDGLFYYVAQEEIAIRENPAKRTSEILQRVFG